MMAAVASQHAPFSKDEMLAELRIILLVQASHIAVVGGQEATFAFLGFPLDDFINSGLDWKEAEKIDLSRFDITRVFDVAYDYAFQVGVYWDFEIDLELSVFEGGVPHYDGSGTQNPFYSDGSKCRHVLDMALGRFYLDQQTNLSIRRLSLLANMTEAAVRTSLSSEGIKTEGKPASLPADVALEWLGRRRGFTPTRKDEAVEAVGAAYFRALSASGPFEKALQTSMGYREISVAEVAEGTGLDIGFIRALVDGPQSTGDIDALRRIADFLKLDVPLFVGKAIEAWLRHQTEASVEATADV